jgi:hypothetical protein
MHLRWESIPEAFFALAVPNMSMLVPKGKLFPLATPTTHFSSII